MRTLADQAPIRRTLLASPITPLVSTHVHTMRPWPFLSPYLCSLRPAFALKKVQSDKISGMNTHRRFRHPRHCHCSTLLSAPWAHFLTCPSISPHFPTLLTVEVSWQLSFEFVVDAAGKGAGWRVETTTIEEVHVPASRTDKSLAPKTPEDNVSVKATAPEHVTVEVVKWQLPIEVLPADPMHVPFPRAVARKLSSDA